MSEKNAGSALLLALVVCICALALGTAAPKWCSTGPVGTLFMACERIASR